METTSQIKTAQQLVELNQSKIQALQEIEKIESKMEDLLNGMTGNAPPKSAPKVPAKKAPKKAAKQTPKVTKPAKEKPSKVGRPKAVAKLKKQGAKKKAQPGQKARGSLKTEILQALAKAGEKGMSVQELAKKVKRPEGNLHVWFSTTGKKIEGITKIEKGQYSYSA